MKKLITGFLLTLMSVPLFANFNNDGHQEALKRRALFEEAIAPSDVNLSLNEYLNCITYDLRNGSKKVTFAAEFIKKIDSDNYSSEGIGSSIFSSSKYVLSNKGLSASAESGEDSYIKTFRVTSTGVLLVEVAREIGLISRRSYPKSVVSDEYQGIIYGACEYRYNVNLSNISEYKILDK